MARRQYALYCRSVSKLGSRLLHLHSAGPGSTPPRAPQTASQLANPAAACPPKAHGDRTRVLEDLRQRIARVIARAPILAQPCKPSDGELPFVEERTELGPLYVRQLCLELHHRVGRFPVGPAQRADMQMLSLLALDPKLASVDPCRALYLDTETTGLSGGTGTLVFLLGLGWFDESGALGVEQLLLRRPGEEAPILQRLTQRMQRASMLVTFNGKAFDLPLVRTRYVMNRMSCEAPDRHLDLLHVARRVHRSRIGNCSLGTVESKVLGFGRVDDVPSGEVSARYTHFLRTGDEGALLGVVDHNAWDVVAMVALVGLYGEPLDGLIGEDLACVAATLHRAKCSGRAQAMAHEAVIRGGGAPALRTRGMLAKARGDRDLALADFEALVREVDDGSVRLELAKLYEHHRKAPGQALAFVEQGTSESSQASSHRKRRLERKLQKAQKSAEQPAGEPDGQVALPGVGRARLEDP